VLYFLCNLKPSVTEVSAGGVREYCFEAKLSQPPFGLFYDLFFFPRYRLYIFDDMD
jgi:hypothetical protein